jgi:hypothetical protein
MEEILESCVIDCAVEECSYNKDLACHARGITIGDNSHPRCDTFMRSSLKGGITDVTAEVGACKVSGCMYNQSLECTAEGIQIGSHSNHPDCLTFKKK